MEAILQSIKKRMIPANPSIVISDRSDATGLGIAERLGVKTTVIESTQYDKNRWRYDQRIADELARNGVTPKDGLVCLAGFMRIISPEFVRLYQNRIINIHPALLPSFKGLGAQRQALEYGVRYSGCTVHFVDPEVDTGPIILQRVVHISEDDTEDTLSARILAEEHIAYPEAVRLFALGKLCVHGRKVVIK